MRREVKVGCKRRMRKGVKVGREERRKEEKEKEG